VDLLLAGRAHSYERFAPQNAAGAADPHGIREIIVGTGGRDSQGFGTSAANSQVRQNKIYGVMKLSLTPTGYTWAFVADPETPFTDSGSLQNEQTGAALHIRPGSEPVYPRMRS
jgi:hypothetical protein